MNIITKTGFNLTISYNAQNKVKTFELAKGGWCDFNDLDEFCEACIPGYIIGSRSIDQMVALADKIYRHYTQKNKMPLHSSLKKQVAKNKLRPSNLQRHIGV